MGGVVIHLNDVINLSCVFNLLYNLDIKSFLDLDLDPFPDFIKRRCSRYSRTPKRLTGPWPQTDTFPHHTPGYFISPCAYCRLVGDLGQNNAYLWLSPAQCNCVFKWGPFSSRPLRGERSTLIHHSVTQPLQEVVNMGDLWDGGSHCWQGVWSWGFRRDIQNISCHFIAGRDISQSVNPSINLPVCSAKPDGSSEVWRKQKASSSSKENQKKNFKKNAFFMIIEHL